MLHAHVLQENYMHTHVNQFSLQNKRPDEQLPLGCTFLAIGDNLLSVFMLFFKSDFYFPNWCTDPPNIVKFQTNYFPGVQQSVTLNCEAEGNPPPTCTWIPCDSDQVCDKNTLHTSQVFNDANYTCRVANALGVDSKTANVCKSDVHFSHALEFESKSSLWHEQLI